MIEHVYNWCIDFFRKTPCKNYHIFVFKNCNFLFSSVHWMLIESQRCICHDSQIYLLVVDVHVLGLFRNYFFITAKSRSHGFFLSSVSVNFVCLDGTDREQMWSRWCQYFELVYMMTEIWFITKRICLYDIKLEIIFLENEKENQKYILDSSQKIGKTIFCVLGALVFIWTLM